jgi:sterol 3beta-glucosyltransferase
MKGFKFTRNSQSSRDSDDSLADSVDSNPPSISRIFADAALYDDVLVQQGCTQSKLSEGDLHVASGFAKLVGRDLTPSEKAIAGRLTKLSVTGDHWAADELTEEPESYADSETSSDPEPHTASSTASSLSSDGYYKAWKPEPEELIQLFVDEFGALAVGDEKEEVVFETDAALFMDVIVVVSDHLTLFYLSLNVPLGHTRAWCM